MCGCPVVCFDDNAASELIIHKKNGFLLKKEMIKMQLKIFYYGQKKQKFF